MYQVRTDLAMETREKFEEDHVEVKGVRLTEEKLDHHMKKTSVVIETENGAKIMGKPKGTYITLEAPDMETADDGYHREISVQLSEILKELLPVEKKEVSVLVAGLGNREVTPDALGPRVVDNLMITRHIIEQYGAYAFGIKRNHKISSVVPGVMAQTGMESLEIIQGIIRETKPDYLMIIDALAARSTRRLNRTIQISDAGISPGSGVGNHRQAINRETLGIPVIAIGVPTVVDATTIVGDTMENLIVAMAQVRKLEGLSDSLDELSETEQRALIRELLPSGFRTMFVTPKDIDESIKQLSYTISEAINMTFFGDAQQV